MKTLVKRFLAASLAIATAITVTACSSGAPAASSSTPAAPAASAEPAANSQTPAPANTQTYTLMYGHAQNETHPYQKAFQDWADKVAADTNGGLTIEIYPSNTLGSEEDIINSFKNSDTNWGYNTDFARLGTYVPNLALFNLPYFVESLDDINAVKKLDLTQTWIKQLENEFDVKVLSLNLVQGYRNVVTGKEVKSPADLKGLTLRSPNTDIWRAAVSSLGCNVQGMGRGDIYNNLVNKVIDGYEDVYPAIVAGSFFEIKTATVISETHNILLMNPVVVDLGWFNSLPAEYQEILVKDCDEIMSACSDLMLGAFTEEAKQKCIAEGMTVVDYADVDVDAFREASKASYETLGLTDLYNEVRAALGK